jgi:hypothetical protein
MIQAMYAVILTCRKTGAKKNIACNNFSNIDLILSRQIRINRPVISICDLT